jgi:hypothetical protein
MTPNVQKMFGFSAFVDGKSRGAGHNRKVFHRLSDGARQVVYTLHGHEVASLTETDDGGYDLYLDNCGYTTQTTSAAICEFLDNVGIPCIHASASTVRLSSTDNTVKYDRYITIPLNRDYKPVKQYSDFRVIGTKLHCKLWGNETVPREMAGEYILTFYGIPGDIARLREVTRGYVTAEYDDLKYITRARTPETREVRLMTAVLRGGAVLHNWDSSREVRYERL